MVQTPDAVYSVIEHLRGNSANHMASYAALCADLHALAAVDWINTYILDEARMPRGCVVVTPAGGYGRGLGNTPIAHHRANVKCYAKYGHDAARMATLVRWLLLPPESQETGWTAAGTTVVDVVSATSPVALTDPQSWEYRDFFVELKAYEAVLA